MYDYCFNMSAIAIEISVPVYTCYFTSTQCYGCSSVYSSVKNNMARFRKWLNLESVIGHTPAQDVMEVLGYLAYDTVREVG